jgi:hypothetical protein
MLHLYNIVIQTVLPLGDKSILLLTGIFLRNLYLFVKGNDLKAFMTFCVTGNI